MARMINFMSCAVYHNLKCEHTEWEIRKQNEEIPLQNNAFNSFGYISWIYSNSWIIQKLHYLAHTVIPI